MIGRWKRALVLAPHTDDGEFGCGGTMARLVEEGTEVRYVAFSIATRSLPEGFPPDTLAARGRRRDRRARHRRASTSPCTTSTCARFPEHRQEILELLIALWNEWEPDVVFQPSLHDIHQDHQTIAAGGAARVQAHDDPRLRDPLEQPRLRLPGVRRLERRHLERKAAALARYASQQHRRYADPEYVWNLARTHGININREYAEVFQVYRAIG